MNKKPKRPSLNSTFTYIIALLALIGLVQLFTGGFGDGARVKDIKSSQFIEQLEDGKIKGFEIQIGSGAYVVTGDYRDTSNKTSKKESDKLIEIFETSQTPTKKFKTHILGNDATLEKVTQLAKENKTTVKTLPESSTVMWLSMLPFLILLIPTFFIMYTMMSQAGGGGKGMMNFGKAKTKVQSEDNVKVRFDDVAGAEEEKQELVEIVEFLKAPDRFTQLGARIPAGVLLEGPPGTGKTLLAKAVAGEAGVPFFSISGSEFVEMFVGVGASRVRDLFENAKKAAPAIIFIDEIDAVGRARGIGIGGGHDEREQTLNQLLVEMDGFEGNEGVIVMAASNRADVLDPALLRPGRFDRQILVGNPDVKGREAILRVHARNKKIAKDVDLKLVAQQTPGFSGADLENLLNEAALQAARHNRKQITAADVDEAHDRVIAGPAKADKKMSDKQRNTVAYHEAGHTVVGMVLSDARVVHKVTIVPRGRAGGYAIMLPKEDQYIVTYKELFEQVVGLLGGRVAEEIVFQSQSTGASNDFQQATQIVRSMITEYGMSDKLGTIQYGGNSQTMRGRQFGQELTYSERTAYEIDEEVRRIMAQAYEEAKRIIEQHRAQLNTIAEKLLEVETLDANEIKALFETGHMPVKEETEEEAPVEADSFEEAKEKAQENIEDEATEENDNSLNQVVEEPTDEQEITIQKDNQVTDHSSEE